MGFDDEAMFLRFLRSEADVEIFRGRAPSPDQLTVPEFAADESSYWIHNRAFPWTPRFAAVGSPPAYYHVDDRHAPLLEYLRHPLQATDPMVAGRLYWSKFFTAKPRDLQYDVAAFDAWVSKTMRWVRKHGCKERHGKSEAWFLPAAHAQLFGVP